MKAGKVVQSLKQGKIIWRREGAGEFQYYFNKEKKRLMCRYIPDKLEGKNVPMWEPTRVMTVIHLLADDWEVV